MAENITRKFKIGPQKDKDELLKRIPYEPGKAKAPLDAEESEPLKKEAEAVGAKPEKPVEDKPDGLTREPVGFEDIEKEEEVKELEKDWKTHMKRTEPIADEEEKGKPERVSSETRVGEKGPRKLKTYIIASIILVVLSVAGASAGYLYSNPEKFKEIIGSFSLSKVSKSSSEGGVISPVPTIKKDQGTTTPSKAKVGYVKDGDVYFDENKVLDTEGGWYGPQRKIHILPGGKRVAYLTLSKEDADTFTGLSNGTEGPVFGILTILNLGNGKVKDFPDEKIYLNSGIAVSPDGAKIAYVSDPFGLRQVDIDSSEIEDLDESLEFKVVGGALHYSSDGKPASPAGGYLYYSLAVGGGEDEDYTLEVWRINLESKSREPVIEVEKTTAPVVLGSPLGVDFDILEDLIAYRKAGDLVVYSIEKDTEKFKTVGSRGLTNLTFVGSLISAIDDGADDLGVSLFSPNTGKESRLGSDENNKIIETLKLNEESIISQRVVGVTPLQDQNLILEIEMFLKGEDGPIYFLVQTNTDMDSFELISKNAQLPFPIGD